MKLNRSRGFTLSQGFLKLSVITGAWFVTIAPISKLSAAPLTNDVSAISISTGKEISDGASSSPSVSGDNNLVVFSSLGTNLVTSPATSSSQIFLRNRSAQTTSLISKLNSTAGNGAAYSPKISNDGSTIVFATAATNLGNAPSAASSIYSANVSTGALTLISSGAAFKAANVNNLSPSISDDGTKILFLSDIPYGSCNSGVSVILNSSSTLSCVSSGSQIINMTPSEAVISGDGSTVALVAASSSNDSQVYTVNLSDTSTATRISEFSGSVGNKSSSEVSISEDGASVAFSSTATNLTASGQTNGNKGVYLYRQGHSPEIVLVSKNADGNKCNGTSALPAISPNGDYVAFVSTCTDLISANLTDPNSAQVFIYSVGSGTVTARASVRAPGGVIDGNAGGQLAIDDAGQVVVFASDVSNVVSSPRDTNAAIDIFLYDSSCSSNSDGAGRADCSDECPFDSAKDADEGACGCGYSDDDSDSDGRSDCEDVCPADPLKSTSDGLCGCGVSETDADGNGQPDCTDPSSTYVPLPLKFAADPLRRSAVLTFPGSFVDKSVTFEYQFIRGNRVVLRGTTKSRTYRVRHLALGRYELRYRVKTTLVSSKWSKKVSINQRLVKK